MSLPEKYTVNGVIPSNMGAVADLYMEVRTLRLAMEKEVKPIQQRESELREYMIANISKSRDEGGDTGAAGKYYRVQIKDRETLRVTDWNELHRYILENDRFDLLQKRPNEKPILELLDDEPVPGVEPMLIPEVSVTKIKA